MTQPRIPWTRLGAEFVVIVVGVLVALWADSWWEARQDRARERGALEEVVADLEQDSLDLDRLRTSRREWDAAAAWMDRSAERATVPADSLTWLLLALRQTDIYQPVSSSYAGLRDAGLMHLIQDDQIRGAIVAYFEQTQPYMVQYSDIGFAHWQRWFEVAEGHLDFHLPEGAATMFEARNHPRLLTSWQDLMRDRVATLHVDLMGTLAGAAVARVDAAQASNAELRRSISDYLSGAR